MTCYVCNYLWMSDSLKYVFSYMFENEMYIKYLVSSILVKLTGAPLMFLLRFHIEQLSMFVYLMLIALLRVDVSKDQTFRGNGQIFLFRLYLQVCYAYRSCKSWRTQLVQIFLVFRQNRKKPFLPRKCI